MLSNIILASHPETQFAAMPEETKAFLICKGVPDWLIEELAIACTSDVTTIGPLELTAGISIIENHIGKPTPR